MELQQSSLYAKYLRRLGWNVLTLDKVKIFVKHFPILGGLAKIQRFTKLPPLPKLIPLLKRQGVRIVAAEPGSEVDFRRFSKWDKKIAKYFRLNRSPYLATKTIIIDLTPSQEIIFQHFSEAKRRAVRRTVKNKVFIEENSQNIELLIKIKNQSSGLFGFITTSGIKQLWQTFAPGKATTLLAYSPEGNLIAGVLLLFNDKKTYYWIAGATREGKRLFAPTLLVWESLKLAKKRSSKYFDFVGVWDERMPHDNKSWKGFTKFKEGFGGKPLYYPLTNH